MFYKDIQSIIDEYAFHLNVADEYKKLNDKYNLKKIYTDYVMEYMLKYSQKLEENWQILDCYEKCYEEFLKTDSDIKIYSKYINLVNWIRNNKYMHVEYEYKFIENLFDWKDEEEKSQFLYHCALAASEHWDLEEVD
tara:strand:- start:269 stop:679 length:411 start_codon:yes stop_codon:yes gene_type:complete